MDTMQNDIYLHQRAKLTNLYTPYSEYVNTDKYPDQDYSKLNTKITLKFRNRYKPVFPTDEDMSPVEKLEDDWHYYETRDDMVVLRYDKVEPYTLIAISSDYSVIIVADTRKYEDTVYKYPKQNTEYLGYYTEDHYFANLDTINGVTISVDYGESCRSVIMEYIEATNTVRFITEDEAFCKIFYKDDEAAVPGYEGLLNELEIISLRKELLEGQMIYGIGKIRIS